MRIISNDPDKADRAERCYMHKRSSVLAPGCWPMSLPSREAYGTVAHGHQLDLPSKVVLVNTYL